MSLWKRFKEELGKGYDQVNTLDGGKSYTTRTSSGPVGMDRIRDTFDANSRWDYEKRNARAAEGVQGYRPNMSYYDEQTQINGVKRPYRNPGQMFLGNTARFMNSLAAAAVVTPETLRGTVADLTHNDEARAASLKRQKFLNEAAFDPNAGLFGAGTIYDSGKDFENSTPANTVKKVATSTAGTALEVAPFTKGAGLAKNAGYQAMSKGKQVIARTLAGAAENTGQDLIEQSFVNNKWNPTQTLISAGIGAVVPNAGDAAKSTVKVVKKGSQAAKDEVNKVGGIKNLIDPTKDNEFMQYRTNYDTYAKAWDKETNPTLRKQIEAGLKQESENMNRRVAELRQNTGTTLGSGPMAGYDAINNAKAKNAENALPNEVKKGQTQQAGSILPTMEELRARQGNVSQAQEIASKYGGKLEDVQRNIDRHGYEATNNMYARKSDSAAFNPYTNQGIRNLDAVVTSELNKQNPNIKVINQTQPTVKVMSPEEEASLFASAPNSVKVTTPEPQPTVKIQGGNQAIVNKANEPNFVFRQIDDDIYTMRASGATDKEIIQQLKSEGNKDDDIVEALLRTSIDEQPNVKVEQPTPQVGKTPTVKLTVEGGKKAEFPAKYYRIGELPDSKGSRNWRTGEREGGISVMKGYEDPKTGKITLDGLQNENLELLQKGEKLYEVDGKFNGLYGADGEELLDMNGIKYTREIDASKAVTDNNPDYNLLGDDVSEIFDTFPVAQVGKTVTPEPTVKVVNGQRIDTTTGEILDTPSEPAKDLNDFIEKLPDSNNVTREEADALILEGTDWLRKGAQAIDDALKRDGDSYENFSRAIHQANIDGVEPPAKYAQYYNEFVKPALDKYRDASGRIVGENIGDVDKYYLPRMRVTDAGQVVFDDTTLINSIDNKVFGSSMSRRTDEFQLGVDDIDHTPEGLSRYATQTLSERYRDAKAVGKVIDQAKARGVELDVPQARTVVDMENQLSQEISDAARKGGVFASGTEKLDLVDSIGKIGTAKGKEKFVLDKGLSWANRQISDSNELYDIPYGGSGKTVGEVMGFERYTRAEAGAVLLDDTVTKNGLDVAEHLDDYYKEVNIDPDAKAKIIENTRKRIDYINNKLASMTDRDGNPVFTEDQLLSRRQHAYINAEKNIARQQLVEFLENTEVQSKQLKKNINQDARRMLVMDASNRSIADKTVGAIVGIKYVGLLGYSVRSALFNVLESRRVFSKYGTKDFLHGVYQAFKDPEMARRMGVHETRVSDVLDVQNKNINPKWWKPMGLFQKSEQWKDNVLLHASQNHYKSKGLGDAELLDAVLDDFNKYGIKYGQAGTLGFNKSKTGRLAGQFLQFAIKDWKIRISEGIKAMGGKGATEAEKKAAQAYIARDIPATLATYLTMSAALGISWQEVAGLINPMQSSPIDKDAPTDVKVVNSVPGGPFIQDMKDLYIATRMAFEEAEEGETPQLGEVYKNQLIKDALTYVPGGQQIFNRTGEFINDQMRGYDENSQGRARYEAADDPLNIAKGLIFGGYTTDNAREYYGRTGVAGDLPWFGGEQKRPVSEQYQELVDNGANPGDVINQSRTKQERDAKFYNTPQGKAWKELYSTTYNPDTKKEESDVISPEKWKSVLSDKSSKTYSQLKEAATQRNKDFGDAIDPLFTDKWSRYKNEIMTMRSQYTGDDKEMKDIANATKPWYKEYMKDYINYINQIKDKEYEESDLYGVSPRVKDYWDLTTKNPSIPENTAKDFPLISQYYDIKNNQGDDKAKEFFKANADALSAAFDAQTKQKFEWTNQMRALEGADPIDWDTFQNITFGFEADEASVYKQLGYKLGKFGSGSGGSSKGSNAQEADYGRMRAAPQPTIKVKVSKVKATPKPVKTIAIKRTGKRI